MNSYELSRSFWDWAFENPDKIKPVHSAIYFFAIEHNNRLGWRKYFGFPSQMAMDAVGIKNGRTYRKALDELEDFGFVIFKERSKNQYSANIIALSKNTQALDKALDKAMIKHHTKQDTKQDTKQSLGIAPIDKPINQLTNKPIKQETMIFLFDDDLFKQSFIKYESFICEKRKLDYGVSQIELDSMQKLLNSWSGGDIQKAIEIIDDNISGGYKKLYHNPSESKNNSTFKKVTSKDFEL